MLFALAVLEAAAWFPRFKNANASAGFLITLAAPFTIAAAVCGWLLSHEGGYEPGLLAWHKWLGIATAAGCTLAAVLNWKKSINAYRVVLFVTVAVLMAAGHLGGSLTHGSDYLTQYAPGLVKKMLGATAANPDSAGAGGDLSGVPVFSGVIEPILKSRCVNCHGPEKSKADLRLDSYAALMKGGEDGEVIVPGDAGQSPLVQRLLLPLDSDDHMPPAGKPQLSRGQIALLKWWVEQGAPENKTLAELQVPSEILRPLSASGPQ